MDGEHLLPATQGRVVRHGPVQVCQLQQAGNHPGRLPERQLEQDLDSQSKLDRRIREYRRATRAAVMRREPGHVLVQPPSHACRHELPGRGSAATHACAAPQSSWTSSWCGSARGMACSSSPSNSMGSRCEFSTARVVQQRLNRPKDDCAVACDRGVLSTVLQENFLLGLKMTQNTLVRGSWVFI